MLFDRLTDEEKTMLRKPGEEVDAEKADALYKKIQAIMDLLREAANADYCDWGIGPINVETQLPHLGKAQSLANLALWAAAYRLPGDAAGAIDDLAVRARLGDHLTDSMIGLLVAGSFETGANRLLRDSIGSLDGEALLKAREFTATSTIDKDVSRAMQGDISLAEAFWKTLAAQSPDARIKSLGLTGETPEEQTLMSQLKGKINDSTWLAAEIAYVRGVKERMAGAMFLPEAEFRNWMKGVEAENKGQHPLGITMFPGYDNLYSLLQKLRVERTLFSAGVEIMQSGPAQLAHFPDPSTGNSLLYIPTPTGFDLRSTYEVKGKPLTLSFPQTK